MEHIFNKNPTESILFRHGVQGAGMTHIMLIITWHLHGETAPKVLKMAHPGVVGHLGVGCHEKHQVGLSSSSKGDCGQAPSWG